MELTNSLIRYAAIALAFGLTVFVHELGHFLTARLSGMAVHEFSIGFGRPLLFWFKRGETQYSFRLWPFLSYVRIAGMEPDDDHPRGFDKKRRSARAAVLAMGSVMNFMLAVAIFVAMGIFIGMPVPQNRIQLVMKKSPAARAGLQPGDRIIGVGGRTGLSVEEIRDVIRAHPGRRIMLEIERDGKQLTLPITPRVETETQVEGLKIKKIKIGLIGIGFETRVRPVGVWQSVENGFMFVYNMVHIQIVGIIGVLTRAVPADFMGPVGIADMLNKQAQQGWADFLWMFALFTVAVGFLNLMPIPPLDGSRLVILAIEGIRGKPFDKRKEMVVHIVGLMLFLGLALIVTYKDILRIVSQKSP